MIIVAVVTGVIALYNWIFDEFVNFGEKLMNSFFQVASIISTTGYMTDDYDLWPTFSKMMLFMLFFIGGCSSSTGGGVKVVRVLVGLKLVRRGVSLKLHPNRIAPITLNERELGSDATIRVSNFIFTYVVIILFGTVLLSLDGERFYDKFFCSSFQSGQYRSGI